MEYRKARKYIYVWWRKLRKRHPFLWVIVWFALLLMEDWVLDETRKQIDTSSDALSKYIHMVALNLPFITLFVAAPSVMGWIIWKAWTEAQQEIDARKTLWLLRDEGVQLRSAGITVYGMSSGRTALNIGIGHQSRLRNTFEPFYHLSKSLLTCSQNPSDEWPCTHLILSSIESAEPLYRASAYADFSGGIGAIASMLLSPEHSLHSLFAPYVGPLTSML